MAEYNRPSVPPKRIRTDYPVIDTDPHVKRVFGYARPIDYMVGAGAAIAGPAAFAVMNYYQPGHKGSTGYARTLRLTGGVGIAAAVCIVYTRSINRFYGFSENSREEQMDMREMVDKIKQGEPLYGKSSLSPYMQGVAARNSRYSSLFGFVLPWANFVNHDQHGVDTAKYYQQAERELEAERLEKGGVRT